MPAAVKNFVARIAKQGEDYIITIPREMRTEIKPIHKKYVKVRIEEIGT